MAYIPIYCGNFNLYILLKVDDYIVIRYFIIKKMDVSQFFKFDTSCVVLNSDIKTCENFNAVLRTIFDINNDLSKLVQDWINKFSEETFTNWIVFRQISNPKRFLFKKIYKCQHNEKNKSKHTELKTRNRNLKCDATITILIKKITKDTIKNDNLLKDGLNTEIKVRDNIVYIFKQYNISYRIFTLLYYYT